MVLIKCKQTIRWRRKNNKYIQRSLKILIGQKDKNENDSWGKNLQFKPTFTIREINEHKIKSGNTKETVIRKTLQRGQKFKEERYLSSNKILTKHDKNNFYIKGQ